MFLFCRMVTLSFAAQDMIFVYCSNIGHQQALTWIILAINAKKSQFGTKFMEIKKIMSYLLISIYYLLNTFFANFGQT